MEYARPPAELSSEGPMDENWKGWRNQFLIFLKASGSDKKPTDIKASCFLNLIGPVGQKILAKLSFDSENDQEDFDVLLKKFDLYFLPKETEVHARYVFFTSVRKQSESINQYVNTLKKRASACNFGDLTESLIRDKIIMDVKNKELRKLYLRSSNLSLKETIELWETCETTEKLTNSILPKLLSDPNVKSGITANMAVNKQPCGKCGTQHDSKSCPARGEICDNCGMKNHFGAVCTKPSVRKSVSDNEEVEDQAVGESSKTVPKYFNPGPITKVPGCTRKTSYE